MHHGGNYLSFSIMCVLKSQISNNFKQLLPNVPTILYCLYIVHMCLFYTFRKKKKYLA